MTTFNIFDTCNTGRGDEVERFLDALCINRIERPVNLFLFTRAEFMTFFTDAKPQLWNPVCRFQCKTRGVHYFDGTTHSISIIMDTGWQAGLRHELVHCRQAEKVGVILWTQLTDIYADDRNNDPFEIEAYLREREI